VVNILHLIFMISTVDNNICADDPMYAVELTHTFALEIEYQMKDGRSVDGVGSRHQMVPARRIINSSFGAEQGLYARATAANEATAANPEYSGVIFGCGGQLSLEVRDFASAYTSFLKAFTAFESSGSEKKIDCIKCVGAFFGL
jgi:hypothetical protein